MERRYLLFTAAALSPSILSHGVSGAAINVAPPGTAQQRTTCFGHPADRAIDGDMGPFTHTRWGDTAPAWEVGLGQPALIQRIVLTNRPGYLSRLRDITVFILGEGGDAGCGPAQFIRGDANDAGGVNIADAVACAYQHCP